MKIHSCSLLLILVVISHVTTLFSSDLTSAISVPKARQELRGFDVQSALEKENVVPVIVIGSGPAGMSAALWTSRAKYKTVVVAGPKPGGQLMEVKSIENWPGRPQSSGIEAIEDLKKQAEHFGTQVVYDTVLKVDFSQWPFMVETEKGTRMYGLSVIIATGGSPKRLEIPGVERYWSKGVGTCSICDAPFAKGKKIIIVGGTDMAADRALQFAAYAKKVFMVVKEPGLKACGTVQDYLEENSKIKCLFNTEILEITGDGRKVTGVKIRDLASGQEKKMVIDGVYFGIGYTPNTSLFKDFVGLDEKGFVLRRPSSQQSSVKGVFVAGDVDDNPHRKAAVAAGNGVEAALEDIDFLQELGISPDVSKSVKYPDFVVPDPGDIQEVTTLASLQGIIKSSPQVLVEFYADNCGMCRVLAHDLDDIASTYSDSLKVIKVSQNKGAEGLCEYYRITSVPTFIMFGGGRERGRLASVSKSQNLHDFVDQFVKTESEESDSPEVSED